MIKAKATTTKTTAPKTKARSVAPIAHGVGRRKSSIARIWLRPGKGSIVVNGKDFKEYFETEVTRLDASKVFRVMTVELNFDVEANVTGGGNCSQAGAVQLGIARALLAANEGLRPMLRQHELLTVDSRVKERKKYGQKAARRKFQFVKR